MSTIYIHDTGYAKVGSETGTAFSVVNNGDEIPLKILRLSYSRGIKLDNSPQPGIYSETELNFASIQNPTLTISGEIHKKGDLSSATNTTYQIHGSDASITDSTGTSSSNEIDVLGLMDRICKTKGYKELYYKSSDTDNLIYGLVDPSDTESTSDIANESYRHLHVRCKGFSVIEVPNSKLITWQLTCEITG